MMMSAILFLLVGVASGCMAALYWRRKKDEDTPASRKRFRPVLGFTRLDGGESLSLLLNNDSSERVWVEEIELFLSGLKADQQASEPSCHGTQKILQAVRSGDMLPVSLAQAIYNAAGSPQRRYSCLLSSVVRYRIGEESFEKSMESYRIQMNGLKASRVYREGKASPAVPQPLKLEENRPMEVKAK